MSYLLDVNVLVSLFDAQHVNHDAAHHWFGTADALARGSADGRTASNGTGDNRQGPHRLAARQHDGGRRG